MALGSKKKKKRFEEIAIIFDIGSASIGGALVSLVDAGKPEIFYVSRKEMSFSSEANPKRLLSAMKGSLEQVALDLQNKGLKNLTFTGFGHKKINNIYCVFSSPWYISQTKVIHSDFRKEKIITDEMIEDILQKEEEDFLSTGSGKYSKKKKEDLYLLEHNIIQLKLNGYDTQKPNGKKAKHLELSIFMSMIPSVAAQAAIEVVAKVFHTENLHIHSFALASYSVLRSIFKNKDDFLLLDISGEVTDVILVSDGILVESVSFPFGKHKLARVLSKSFGTTPEEALSRVVIQGSKSNLPVQEGGVMVLGKTQEILNNLKEQWNNNLNLILKDFGKEYPIPQTLFFLSDNNVVPVFKHFLETGLIATFISPDDTFSAIPIGNQIFEKYITYKDKNKLDPFLAIETIFFNTAHKPHD